MLWRIITKIYYNRTFAVGFAEVIGHQKHHEMLIKARHYFIRVVHCNPKGEHKAVQVVYFS